MTRVILFISLIATHAVAQTIELVAISTDSKAIGYLVDDGSSELESQSLVVRDLESGEEKEAPFAGNWKDTLVARVPALAAIRPGSRWVAPACGQFAPTSHARIDVKVVPASAGAWAKSGWWYADNAAAWKISVTRDDVERAVIQVPPGDELVPCWTPDGKRMVILVQTLSAGMRDPGRSELFIGSDGAPLIGIVGPTLESAQAAAMRLSRKGSVVSSVSRSRKNRETTTIYFASGQESLGKQVAEQFPGSAVIAMDWSSPFPVVVALGGK